MQEKVDSSWLPSPPRCSIDGVWSLPLPRAQPSIDLLQTMGSSGKAQLSHHASDKSNTAAWSTEGDAGAIGVG
uniref:Uncharacterized protein n=1 Tax=Leersia perrieri TaxID=77586 RepID=A0A0D9XV59_9ORYZ